MSFKTGIKVRSESAEDIKELLKRKRDRMEQSVEKEEVKDIFRRSKRTVRSPGNKKEGREEAGDVSGDEKHKKEVGGIWLEEIKKEMREGLKGVREEKEEMCNMVKDVMRGGLNEIKREKKSERR